jgi:hypothetical protein
VSDPGERFAYSRSAAHLIRAVLAEAVDRSVLDCARESCSILSGWWVGDDAYGYPWFDSGWFGHLVIGIPDLQLVIAVSSADGVSDDAQQALLPLIVEEVLKPFT